MSQPVGVLGIDAHRSGEVVLVRLEGDADEHGALPAGQIVLLGLALAEVVVQTVDRRQVVGVDTEEDGVDRLGFGSLAAVLGQVEVSAVFPAAAGRTSSPNAWSGGSPEPPRRGPRPGENVGVLALQVRRIDGFLLLEMRDELGDAIAFEKELNHVSTPWGWALSANINGWAR